MKIENEKKWHLHEHVADILDWWTDANDHSYYSLPEEQLRFIAYERWLNDRELLTIEDGYEWLWTRPVNDREMSPAPDRPTHAGGIWTRTRIEAA